SCKALLDSGPNRSHRRGDSDYTQGHFGRLRRGNRCSWTVPALPRCALLSQLHERLVYSDANQPCRELRVSLESAQILMSFEECSLDNLFRIFGIMRHILGDAKQLAFVPPYQF